MSHKIVAIVLAAGKGSRMKSDLPKVLHPINQKPMVEYALGYLKESLVEKTLIVLGKDLSPFQNLITKFPEMVVCTQNKPRGTGDAVASTAKVFQDVTQPGYIDCDSKENILTSEYVLVCTGDLPTFTTAMLNQFIEESLEAKVDLSVLGFKPEDNTGYGRLVTNDQQHLLKIVEQKDCSAEESKIELCNSGIIIAKTKTLFDLLSKISNQNQQNEYYLTDCIQLATNSELKVSWSLGEPWRNLVGVNTQQQLLEVEAYLYKNT